ncbi:TRAP transporter large permease [uncultured Planococcus sp.]|uniref:TRAP transporter large permease n=1 Tax=uncultured Planococcus sp. TaxID=337815 RepID=UPI002636CF77|nr:TRAP transporter large permease [uncultured Planococcus sp.]
MSTETVGVLVVAAVFVLMFLRVPIAIAMVIPASFAIIFLRGWDTLASVIHSVVWTQSYHYTLSTIPLFVLMGQLLFASGVTDDLFKTFKNWFGNLKGGLGMATIGASAMFATASGSSVATTGTMGVIATKEMLKGGYSKSLAGGSIVAGGALGILIPPSTTFIVYGMLTEQSVGKLLTAGIFPGILLTLFFMLTIYICVLIKPSMITAAVPEYVSWKERFSSLSSNIWILLLFVLVMGGIYFGYFTATESAGVGAFGAFLIGVIRRRLNLKSFTEALLGTLRTTGFLFAIILGAFILNYILILTRVPNLLAEFLLTADLSATMIFVLIICLFILLGAIMDSLAMMVVTIPILMPILEILNFDLIWFGVMIVLVVEIALISPPIGMNVFVLKGVTKDLEIVDIFKGATIFIVPILAVVILLYIFPDIALFLPNTMD